MSDRTNAHDAVLDAVRQGESRLRRHALVVELSWAAVAAAAVPAALAALRVLRPVPPALIVASFIVPALALAAWAVFRIGRHAAAERTARRMDTDAALNDELVSAHWFASHGPENVWTSAQIDRAATRVAGVDWNAAQPAPRPRRAWAAAAVLVGVTIVLLFVPTGTIGGLASLGAESADAKKDAAIEMIETRIDETEMSDADRLRAEEIITELKREGLTSEEARALMAELEKLLGGEPLDAKMLEDMADALDDAPSLKDLAEALRNQQLAEAAKQARELAEKAPAMEKRERDDLADAMDKAADASQKSLKDLAEEMRDAADKLRGEDGEQMKKSLEKMADSLDQLASEEKQGAEGMQEETEALEQALGEQGEASEQGEKSGESNRQSSQSTGNMQGEGEGMSREAASMPNPSQAAMPGLGQMSGQPQNMPPQQQQALVDGKRRIEVALKEEMVRAHDESGDAKPEELVDRKTERVDSAVQYRRVEGAQNYDLAKAQQEGAVPESLREVVKNYFTALRGKNRNP